MSKKRREGPTSGETAGGIRRRRFLAATAAGVVATRAAMGSAASGPDKKHRVAVIGHTGRGDYGHGLDRVWLDVPETRIVAVADADPQGLARTVKRLGQPKGFTGYFDSVRNGRGKQTRFGLRIFGSQGALHLYETGYLPAVHFLPDSAWSSGRTGKSWVAVSSAGPGKPEPLTAGDLHAGNVAAVEDLIAAVQKDRLPVSNVYEARTATEMIVAVFQSQRLGRPVTFPLKDRQNPLAPLA